MEGRSTLDAPGYLHEKYAYKCRNHSLEEIPFLKRTAAHRPGCRRCCGPD
jgi:hypothetical protein